ncbi:MAG: hypothetical protein ACI4OW_04060 [Alphaproteobacteria bacterium]
MTEKDSKKIPKKSNLERIAAIKYKRAKDMLERKTKAILERKSLLLNKIIEISAIAMLPLPINATSNVKYQTDDDDFLNRENKIENIQGFESQNRAAVYNSIEEFNTTETKRENQIQQQIDSAFNAYVQQRQQTFYNGVYDRLTENITAIKKVTPKKGRAPASILRKLYGKSINVRFYCAYASISAMNQTAQETGCAEFAYLNKCIDNIHYCPSVVNGLKENVDLKDFDRKINSYLNSLPASAETKDLSAFLNAVKRHTHKSPTTQSCRDIAAYMESLGNDTLSVEDRQKMFVGAKKVLGLTGLNDLDKDKLSEEGMALLQDCAMSLNKPRQVVETSNLLDEINAQLESNPNSVFLVVHKSNGNRTGSGLHAVVAMRDRENPGKVKVFSQNGEHIENAEEYFVGMKNRGTLANVSERGSEDFRNNEYANFAQAYRINNLEDGTLLAATGWQPVNNVSQTLSTLTKLSVPQIKPIDIASAVRNLDRLN